LGKGWEDLCAELRGFFTSFSNDGVAARCEADQGGTFMVRVGEEFDQSLLLKAIDQDLNILTGAESGSGDLGHGLRTVALKELKSSPTCARKRCPRIGLEAIGQAIDFYEQGFKPFLWGGSVGCYRGIHDDNMMRTAKYCQQLSLN
jgi:hypothetical protein